MITGKAKLAGVAGWPVGHSLSPLLHNRWLEQAGIDGAYVPLPVQPEDLKEVFRALPRMGFAGWNLTVPHKEAALKLVDDADDAARAIGAVNTVVVKGGKLRGMNTDAAGFYANLVEKTGDLTPYKKSALVLGAGGAARAVAFALKTQGWKRILVSNRTAARAEALAAEFGDPLWALAWNEIPQVLPEVTLLVNTTTLGMDGEPPLELDTGALSPDALVADIVYKPLETPLLRTSAARGCKTVTGLGMLVHQAVPGFVEWFGATPRVEGAEAWLTGQLGA